MSQTSPVLCPDCGWTGDQADLEQRAGSTSCPACDARIERSE